MTDEQLIEEAAKAILTWPPSDRLPDTENARRQARAALAVFEKAHTLTEDEREVVWDEGHEAGWDNALSIHEDNFNPYRKEGKR